MEVTKREILFSTIIFVVFFAIGFLIDQSLSRRLEDHALEVAGRTQVDNNPGRFDYIQRTGVGNFMASGEIRALRGVGYNEIGFRYIEVEKVKEKYTLHTETYTTTDGKGHTQVHTRSYYTWDPVKRNKVKTDSLVFLGKKFGIGDIKYRYELTKTATIKESATIRYVYYTKSDHNQGLMIGVAGTDKTLANLVFKEGKSIETELEEAERYQSNWLTMFWILWALLMAAVIFVCLYHKNNWLEG